MDAAVFSLSLTALVLGMLSRRRLTGFWALLTGLTPGANRDPVRLLPGESLLALVRPDRELCILRLGLTVVAIAAWMRIFSLGSSPTGMLPLVLMAALVAVPILAECTRAARGGWFITDRRLIARSGASTPLSALRRISVGPTALAVETGSGRRFSLSGLANPRAAAELIRDAISD